MTTTPSDLVQGTLDMLILKTLALQPMHGYGITMRLEPGVVICFRIERRVTDLCLRRLPRQQPGVGSCP